MKTRTNTDIYFSLDVYKRQAKLSEYTVRFFNHTPVMAMLSYSNFGADKEGSPVSVHEAVDYMQQNLSLIHIYRSDGSYCDCPHEEKWHGNIYSSCGPSCKTH